MSLLENEARHGLWLEDLLVRLLSVLALDRFGDFVGDSVVCPVRESVGQVVGVVLDNVPFTMINHVVELVPQVMDNTDWHTRHAAMIIVKYILSINSENKEELLTKLYPTIIKGKYILSSLFI